MSSKNVSPLFIFPEFRKFFSRSSISVTIQNIDNCTGCGLCSQICPTVFAIIDDKVRILRQPTEEETELVRLAKTSCPFDCIVIS
ncbi:MAG: ferredoxin [Bacteroidales bacterium]|nr:ferredoxin [Bacteroidales bacterium]